MDRFMGIHPFTEDDTRRYCDWCEAVIVDERFDASVENPHRPGNHILVCERCHDAITEDHDEHD